jgi:hypothetical protein
VWDVYKQGGVLGGTSAGAAIMSNPMIGGGSSLGVLQKGVITDYQGDDFKDEEGVLLSTGLGFFPFGMVDQHFEVRGRFARLMMAVMNNGLQPLPGFGIDENTALVYDGTKRSLKVAGASGVTIFRTEGAIVKKTANGYCLQNFTVSYLQEGDEYDMLQQKVIPAAGKKPVIIQPGSNPESKWQAGVLSGTQDSFRRLLEQLADNSKLKCVENISFIAGDKGFRLSLAKSAQSSYYSDESTGKITALNLTLDIVPVSIAITPLK